MEGKLNKRRRKKQLKSNLLKKKRKKKNASETVFAINFVKLIVSLSYFQL